MNQATKKASGPPEDLHLYVGNLSPRVTEYMLAEAFAITGPVQHVKIIPDRNVSSRERLWKLLHAYFHWPGAIAQYFLPIYNRPFLAQLFYSPTIGVFLRLF